MFFRLIISLLLVSNVSAQHFSKLDSYAFQEETIRELIKDTASYQLKRYGTNIPTKDWLVGTFFSSFVAAYEETGDSWYLEHARSWAERSEWDIRNALDADDVCPGQTYLDLHFIENDAVRYETLHQKLSPYFGRKELLPREFREWEEEAIPFVGRKIWSWCDSLYMAPPVYARMGKATGDVRYFEQLHRFYWDSVDFLYDPKEQLFFRDARYLTKRSPSGEKIFWGRGNGWVIGGLARLIEFLPSVDPMRERYLELFKELAFGIARYQQEDGLWRSSLNEPAWQPTKESSGSAFFVYALAKGINEGWLPREYFAPVVLRGWRGLVDCVSPEGRLGYCQLVAGSPHAVRPNDSKDYAVGAFILAGVEMLKLDARASLRDESTKPFQTQLVAEDAQWSAADPDSVLYHNNVFYVGYRKSEGGLAVTAFGRDTMPSCYSRFEYILTDANLGTVPRIVALSDSSLLAAYEVEEGIEARELSLRRWEEALLGDTRVVSPEELEELVSFALKDSNEEAIDPNNENRKVIAANMHPVTKHRLPQGLNQLFEGTFSEGHWSWRQLTFDPSANMVAPVFVVGVSDTLFWVREAADGRTSILTNFDQ